jgi:hypothetical protein
MVHKREERHVCVTAYAEEWMGMERERERERESRGRWEMRE